MPNDDKLIKVGRLNSKIDKLVGKTISNIDIFRSKGLLIHLLKRKHYTAAKYLDYLPDVLLEYLDGHKFDGSRNEKKSIGVSYGLIFIGK